MVRFQRFHILYRSWTNSQPWKVESSGKSCVDWMVVAVKVDGDAVKKLLPSLRTLGRRWRVYHYVKRYCFRICLSLVPDHRWFCSCLEWRLSSWIHSKLPTHPSRINKALLDGYFNYRKWWYPSLWEKTLGKFTSKMWFVYPNMQPLSFSCEKQVSSIFISCHIYYDMPILGGCCTRESLTCLWTRKILRLRKRVVEPLFISHLLIKLILGNVSLCLRY